MPCYSPHHVHRGDDRPDGKMQIVWSGNNKGLRRLDLPCGRCVGCKLERSRNNATRCLLESQMHERNCFVTLTFDDEHLPANRSLDYVGHFQPFMKRLRKAYGSGIRFFMCGEYGAKLGRPHYHSLLFGHDFDDKVFEVERNGNRLYTSASLQRLWPFGFSSIGEVSYESAAYVARYVLKKASVGKDEHYVDRRTGEVLVPEMTRMSLRPGIAAGWFEKFGLSDVFPRDEMVVGGRVNKPPRYFDKLLERVDPQLYDRVKAARAEFAPEWEEGSDVRLRVKEQVKLAQIKSLKRELR